MTLTGLGARGAGGGGAGCWATGRAAACASLASTRASISRPTRSTNDSRTASRYSDGSSLWISAAARSSPADNGESVTSPTVYRAPWEEDPRRGP